MLRFVSLIGGFILTIIDYILYEKLQCFIMCLSFQTLSLVRKQTAKKQNFLEL